MVVVLDEHFAGLVERVGLGHFDAGQDRLRPVRQVAVLGPDGLVLLQGIGFWYLGPRRHTNQKLHRHQGYRSKRPGLLPGLPFGRAAKGHILPANCWAP